MLPLPIWSVLRIPIVLFQMCAFYNSAEYVAIGFVPILQFFVSADYRLSITDLFNMIIYCVLFVFLFFEIIEFFL